ncbi:sodium/glutamate symporter [Pseudoruegeria sp. SHC-113]|uniref:sodium/glutamate symporter n=1 Tax=Pseudoruegeria sp. SHC-113 TaxID=2855439 RepID=UPI0021BAF533|nr:sodium/glutamate symporter [Pseudoruegeria sp. SHC-113]MCT8160939.1 sodium/glutamate symporter [Pseudoruegeria sp. SHC-113]
MEPQAIVVPEFVAVSFGIFVYLLGVQLTRAWKPLREFNIPEPVSGGLAAALLTFALYRFAGIEISFEMASRDFLLVMFFTGIGLNARMADLIRGGKPLFLLLLLTVAFLFLQNIIGLVSTFLFGLPSQMSVLLGSAALIGGHGTAIAWAPEIAARTGQPGLEEIGIAMATLGLIVAALIGGPIAKILIEGKSLTPDHPEEEGSVGASFEDADRPTITNVGLMRVLLTLNISILLGYMLYEAIATTGLKLPVFVPCLIMGIVIGNLRPVLLPRAPEVSRTPELALISDFTLGLFLAMSLMSLQLWQLAGMGSTLAIVLTLQTVAALAFVLFVLFPVMGSNYRAAVLAAGFGGFALGATPTAIANMTAVTKNYGPSPVAFIILPLVSAFFVDLANAVVIQLFLMF